MYTFVLICVLFYSVYFMSLFCVLCICVFLDPAFGCYTAINVCVIIWWGNCQTLTVAFYGPPCIWIINRLTSSWWWWCLCQSWRRFLKTWSSALIFKYLTSPATLYRSNSNLSLLSLLLPLLLLLLSASSSISSSLSSSSLFFYILSEL